LFNRAPLNCCDHVLKPSRVTLTADDDIHA
jgi:hypothetical protein